MVLFSLALTAEGGCEPDVGRCSKPNKCECNGGSWTNHTCPAKKKACCVPDDPAHLTIGSEWLPCKPMEIVNEGTNIPIHMLNTRKHSRVT